MVSLLEVVLKYSNNNNKRTIKTIGLKRIIIKLEEKENKEHQIVTSIISKYNRNKKYNRISNSVGKTLVSKKKVINLNFPSKYKKRC